MVKMVLKINYLYFLFRSKKVKDIDESEWENKGNGVVVKKQPAGEEIISCEKSEQ